MAWLEGSPNWPNRASLSTPRDLGDKSSLDMERKGLRKQRDGEIGDGELLKTGDDLSTVLDDEPERFRICFVDADIVTAPKLLRLDTGALAEPIVKT